MPETPEPEDQDDEVAIPRGSVYHPDVLVYSQSWRNPWTY